jgi:hypothetical protein
MHQLTSLPTFIKNKLPSYLLEDDAVVHNCVKYSVTFLGSYTSFEKRHKVPGGNAEQPSYLN